MPLHFIYSCYAWPAMYFNNIIMWSLSVLLGFLDRSGTASHYCNIIWAKLTLLVIGVRLEITGAEHILHDRSMIIAANHQSYLDIPVLSSIFWLDYKWVSKQSVFNAPLIGWAMKKAGYISIDRKKTTGNRNSLRQAVQAVLNGSSLIIFPEGTRGTENTVGAFQSGAFSLAVKTDTPVLPITISGTRDIFPNDSKLLRPGKIRVTIHPAIHPQGREKEELCKETRMKIISELKQNC